MQAEEVESTRYRWVFGSAVFDESRFELQVAGQAVDVQHQPLRLLQLLLAEPGTLVTRARIDRALWDERIDAGSVVDNVLANTVSKLRAALGPENAARLVTVPRQGYRLDGPVQRQPLTDGGRALHRLAAGDDVPGRPHFELLHALAPGRANPTWLARHRQTGEQRVYKFALDDGRLASLQREQRVYRLLRHSLGERDDFARVLDWNLRAPPGWLECAHGGTDLARWALAPAGLASLSPAGRLALFLQIVDAVAAAHSVGVLHRDLKPANILIDRRADGGWWARITDFGSAAMLQPERLAALHITQLGATLPAPHGAQASTGGTPLYLAPEQVAGEPATVRSDVYALGLVLCQLLRGDFTRPLASGWQRDIGDALLADDIARATDAQPQRRFSAAAELAEALRALPARHARQQAAQAEAVRAAATRQALQHARARQPWMLAAGLALASGLAASLWLYNAERRAAQALVQQHALVQALNQLLTDDLIGAANPAAAGRADVMVVDALASTAQAIDRRFANAAPQVQAGLHAAMQRALSELSRTQDAVTEGQHALAAFARAPQADLDAVQNTRLRLAVDLAQLSRMDEAAAVVGDAEQAAASTPQPAEFQARLLYAKSWVAGGAQALADSTRLLREAWQLVQPMTVAQAPWREKIAFGLADNLTSQGQHAQGEALYRSLLASQQASHGADHLRTQITKVGLGSNLVYQGRLDDAARLLAEAEQALAQRVGPQHRMTLSAADLQALVLFKQAQYPAAQALWQRVHAGFSALMGPDSGAALAVQANIGLAQHRAGHAAAALPVLQDALQRARSNQPDDAAQVQYLRYLLADCLLDLGQPAPAGTLLQGLRAEAIAEAEQGNDWDARLAWQRGRALLAQGQRSNALPLLEQAAQGLARQKASGPLTEAVVRALINRASAASR